MFPEDARFAGAIEAVSHEIARALATPDQWGVALGHELAGWRRSAFQSRPRGEADLRLIFRPRRSGGIEVLMFGPRRHADATSIYRAAKKRT